MVLPSTRQWRWRIQTSAICRNTVVFQTTKTTCQSFPQFPTVHHPDFAVDDDIAQYFTYACTCWVQHWLIVKQLRTNQKQNVTFLIDVKVCLVKHNENQVVLFIISYLSRNIQNDWDQNRETRQWSENVLR